jgi:AcrR family transcriptional regulator
MTDDTSPAAEPEERRPVRRGRKRDHSRDADILDAALEVLAEVGYSRMTMDTVAARAKAGKATVYRRWPSKAELVVEAIARMNRTQVDLDRPLDTGTLRGDLLGLYRPHSIDEGERRLKIMAGLASMISDDHAVAEAVNAAVVQPWADAHLLFMRRALNRGEIPAAADIESASHVIPSMAAYRALIQRKPFAREFLVALVDGVILPGLGASGANTQTA